ncbi:MAG: response regulator [Candidatus Cloacimonetes bacterium]|nr:response regulator [Candidatus Cloacimonadota bacterium]
MKKKRILIIEDELIIAEEIAIRLKRKGYSVVGICDNAELAIEIIKKKIPDLVLLDITLRGKMDGIELSALIKNNHNIPVIFITANNDNATFEKAVITEPFAYITKPIDDNVLVNSIEIALYKAIIDNERNLLIMNLKKALEENSNLKKILPICACCKKIRDNQGNWYQLEEYIAKVSNINFTHSICDECLKNYYPELSKK